MCNKFFLLIVTILCATGFAHAQAPCSTDEYYHTLLQKYPLLASYEAQFDEQLSAKFAHKTTAVADTNTYDVPIVIHVIHDYGVENIPDDNLYAAAAYWAVVYMKQNADTSDVIAPFKPYVGNPKMRLHLATIDPAGNPTKGIVRVQSYLANIADDQAKYNQWPQNKYVNIWLVGTFGADIGVGTIAYALLPGTVSFEPFYDGVICLSNSINSSTKVVPHELGHVFNLKHPWGNTNNPAVACGDDNVDDTPPTMGHWNVGCVPSALYDTTCATGYHKVYTSSSGLMDSVVDYPDTVNAQNIMDYTDCQKMFTKLQAVRMRTALTSSTAGRNNLYTPANLAATGALAPMPDLPPVAEFIVNRATPVAGFSDKRAYFLTYCNASSFQFQNESWNDTVSGVSWTFSNGATIPTSTSMTTVTNKFSQPGWVTVSLTATSNAGSSTVTNAHAVYAADTVAAGGMGYTQNFASASDVANWPMFNFYNNQFQWEFYNGAGYSDNASIRYRSYDSSTRITGIANGDHDDLYTPAFNLGDASGTVYFNFFTAGASTTHGVSSFDPQQSDSLEIDASVNGGLTWFKVKSFKSDLENNGNYNYEFVPTSSSQWVARAVVLPTTCFTNNTFFRFRFWPGNVGNDLYLDNFALSPFPAGVKETVNAPGSFSIFPNPSANGCTLAFNTGSQGIVSYSVRDLAGKTVYETKETYAPNQLRQDNLPRSLMPASGMYFVTLTVDGVSTTQKLVVY